MIIMAAIVTDFWSVFDYGVFDDIVFDDPESGDTYPKTYVDCPGTVTASVSCPADITPTIDCEGTVGITISCLCET